MPIHTVSTILHITCTADTFLTILLFAGKTWQLWPVDDNNKCSSDIPTGPPQLLMAFTEDGQVNSNLVEERDKYLNISTEEKRKARADKIKPNPVLPGADHWERETPWQIKE